MSESADISLQLKQSINNQVNVLMSLVRSSKQNPETLVHELRKGIKRIRSIFRFFKPVISDFNFHMINEIIAETGRSLTFQRETTVNLLTFNEIVSQLKNIVSDDSKVQIAAFLEDQRQQAYSSWNNQFNNLILKVTFQLSKIRDFVENLKINSYSVELLELAINRDYHKTIVYFNDCKISLHHEAIHKWRRFCKHMSVQLKSDFVPQNQIINEFIKELDSIAELLGKEHDFTILDHLFIRNIYQNLNIMDRDYISHYIEKQRNLLRKLAFNNSLILFKKELSFYELEAISA